MKGLVIHGPTGLLLDFAQEDFGGGDQAAVIEDWRTRPRRSGEPQTSPGEFICHKHRDRQRPNLTLRQLQRGILIAAHWPGSGVAGACAVHHGMTDEHRRGVEYLQRAGEAAGYQVTTEVHLPTRVIPDAVIAGPTLRMGVEVQRYQLTARDARARTTKARRAGVLPVWFAMTAAAPPRWELTVPSARTQKTDWTSLPQPRTVKVVSGVREVAARRCRSIRHNTCPQARSGCNRWHPDHQPLAVMVDDLAESFPAGELVPLLHTTLDRQRQQVLIVPRTHKQRYETLTGESADLPLTLHDRPRRQPGSEIVCAAAAGPTIAAAAAGLEAGEDPSVWRCDRCGFERSVDMTGFRDGGCGGLFWPVAAPTPR